MSSESAPEPAQPSAFSTNAGADMWRHGAARRAQYLGPATELMLDLAGIRSGDRVLDIAAGTGEQSLLAARRVGPSGSVLATDISAQMLEVAAESARKTGLANIETRVLDARELDLAPASFDAVISRLGLMLLPDLPQALRGIYGVLRPGGRCAAIVWGAADHNPLHTRSGALAGTYLQLPSRTGPGAMLFAQGEQNALADALTSARFRDVRIQRESVSRRFASAAEAASELLATMASLSQVRTQLPPEQLAQFLSDLEASLREFEGPDEFVAPGEVVLGVGTR